VGEKGTLAYSDSHLAKATSVSTASVRSWGARNYSQSWAKHKMGKGRLYISKMTDIDVKVLEQLLKKSVAASKKQHG
jgi:hypothetical protein